MPVPASAHLRLPQLLLSPSHGGPEKAYQDQNKRKMLLPESLCLFGDSCADLLVIPRPSREKGCLLILVHLLCVTSLLKLNFVVSEVRFLRCSHFFHSLTLILPPLPSAPFSLGHWGKRLNICHQTSFLSLFLGHRTLILLRVAMNPAKRLHLAACFAVKGGHVTML